MIQAARSGKQNIVEGSVASGTSKETEIKLVNVARASLEALLEDYVDFLRVGGHELWDKESKAALAVRRLAGRGKCGTTGAGGTTGTKKKDGPVLFQGSQGSQPSQESYEIYRPYIETRSPQTVANIIICLIHQTTFLLARQLKQLEETFVEEGGLRERMTRARLKRRSEEAGS